MKIISKFVKASVLCVAVVALGACASSSMKVAQQSKPGFANVSDIPLPQSADIDINKSMVMGGGNTWTGHLVYSTKRSQEDVIDFITSGMQHDDWTKVSETRGKESVIIFMKNKRVATVRVTLDAGYITNKTLVSVDMANTKLRTIKTALVREDEANGSATAIATEKQDV